MPHLTESEKTSINTSCCVFSLVVHVVFSVFMIGAEDILAGTRTPTSTVLMAEIGLSFLVPLLFPYFIDRVPYFIRIVGVVLCHFVSFVIIGMVKDVHVRLFAVSLATFAMGVGNITILSLTSYFKPSAVSWYSTGSGAGLIVGPVYYSVLATWLRISPNVTFVVLAPFSVVYLVCYYFIQKGIPTDELKPLTKNNAVYTMVETSDSEDEDEQKKCSERFVRKNLISFQDKLSAVKKMVLLLAIPLFITFSAEFTLYESIITTIAYPNSPFPPRDHYQYYSIVLMVGEVLGRSNWSILEIVKPDWLFTPKAFLLWLLAAIEGSLLIFLFLESWFRFLPGVGMVIFLCFCSGFVGGFAFTNGIELVRVSFEENVREFMMSVSTLPLNCGILAGALNGFYVEPLLRGHCISTLTDSVYCFTRQEKIY